MLELEFDMNRGDIHYWLAVRICDPTGGSEVIVFDMQKLTYLDSGDMAVGQRRLAIAPSIPSWKGHNIAHIVHATQIA